MLQSERKNQQRKHSKQNQQTKQQNKNQQKPTKMQGDSMCRGQDGKAWAV